MTALSSEELASIRAVADDFLPDTCTIQTRTTTTGSMGGITESYANTYTGVSCRVDPGGSGDEMISNFTVEGETAQMLNVPYTQQIETDMRVVHNGNVYEVRGLANIEQSYATLHRAVIVKIGKFANAFSSGFDIGYY